MEASSTLQARLDRVANTTQSFAVIALALILSVMGILNIVQGQVSRGLLLLAFDGVFLLTGRPHLLGAIIPYFLSPRGRNAASWICALSIAAPPVIAVITNPVWDPRGAAILMIPFFVTGCLGYRWALRGLVLTFVALAIAALVLSTDMHQALIMQHESNSLLILYVALVFIPTAWVILWFQSRSIMQATAIMRDALAYAERRNDEAQDASTKLDVFSDRQRQMLAVISHELRTPVAAAHMLSQSLAESADLTANEELSQELTDLNKTVRHTLRVIDDLRGIINPDEKFKLIFESYNIAQLIQEISVQSRQLCDDKHTNLLIDSAPQVNQALLYRVDAYRVVTIMTNLIRNASTHGKARLIKVGVVTRFPYAPTHRVEFTVDDNGVGIPPQSREKVFELFHRESESTIGTGVGLYLARTWAEQMGGDLQLEESPLGGARFVFSIALSVLPESLQTKAAIKESTPAGTESPAEGATAPAGDTSTAQAVSAEESATAADLFNLRILLVEDDSLLRKLTRSVLERELGAEVVAVAGVDDALSIIAVNPVDVVITDFFMPKRNGDELCRELRSQGAEMPIVAITAATLGEEREQLLIAGADDVLAKPFEVTDFREVLNKYWIQGRLAPKPKIT